ncbi:hypothetical protein Tco_0367216 [Tanacetum coccineum]
MSGSAAAAGPFVRPRRWGGGWWVLVGGDKRESRDRRAGEAKGERREGGVGRGGERWEKGRGEGGKRGRGEIMAESRREGGDDTLMRTHLCGYLTWPGVTGGEEGQWRKGRRGREEERVGGDRRGGEQERRAKGWQMRGESQEVDLRGWLGETRVVAMLHWKGDEEGRRAKGEESYALGASEQTTGQERRKTVEERELGEGLADGNRLRGKEKMGAGGRGRWGRERRRRSAPVWGARRHAGLSGVCRRTPVTVGGRHPHVPLLSESVLVNELVLQFYRLPLPWRNVYGGVGDSWGTRRMFRPVCAFLPVSSLAFFDPAVVARSVPCFRVGRRPFRWGSASRLAPYPTRSRAVVGLLRSCIPSAVGVPFPFGAPRAQPGPNGLGALDFSLGCRSVYAVLPLRKCSLGGTHCFLPGSVLGRCLHWAAGRSELPSIPGVLSGGVRCAPAPLPSPYSTRLLLHSSAVAPSVGG